MAYYDERHLPSPTIRNSSCTIFVGKGAGVLRCRSCEEYRYSKCLRLNNKLLATIFLDQPYIHLYHGKRSENQL